MRTFFTKIFFSLFVSFSFFSCGLPDSLGVSNDKMAEALQEALVLGSITAALNLGDSSCSSATNCATGYLGNKLVEIAVPDTVNNVLGKISSFTDAIPASAKPGLQTALGKDYSALLNLGGYRDSIKTALNRGAEKAAPGSVDVFKSAIYGMSFDDVRGLFDGDSVAGTSYLRTTTYGGLQSSFAPVIKEPLNLLNPNKFWKPIASSYNSFMSKYSSLSSGIAGSALPAAPYDALPDDISAHLAEYATGKALDGLFLMVGKQETSLREDPWGTIFGLKESIGSAVNGLDLDLVGDVFSKSKENKL